MIPTSLSDWIAFSIGFGLSLIGFLLSSGAIGPPS